MNYKKIDVAIIGSGWSGLYAAKYAKNKGLKVAILEKRDCIGGVWNYTRDENFITVMKSTVSSSSRLVTEASDFPMKKEDGNFFGHQKVVQYLEDYCEKFNLKSDIIFNFSVRKADKINGFWHIISENGDLVVADKIVVACGVHQKKRKISGPVSEFNGIVHHSGDFKDFDEVEFSEQDHVIVYGGGETASDIIDELVKKKCQITWAIRGGQHFFRKTAKRYSQIPGEYDLHGEALDEQSTFIHKLFTNFAKGKPGMRWGCNFSSQRSVLSYQGHGLKHWMNDIPWYHAFFNKNGHSVDHVYTGRVVAKPGITKCYSDSSGDLVEFNDGTKVKATHIICCFGYEPGLEFLPENIRKTDTSLNYKLIFNPDDPTVSFIGYARPIISSIPFISEAQCEYASLFWANKIQLPSSKEMKEIAIKDLKDRESYFLNKYENKNIVVHTIYISDIMKCVYGISFQEKYLNIIKSNIRYAGKLFGFPFTPAMFELFRNGKITDQFRERLEKNSFPTIPALSFFPKNSISYLFYGIFAILIPRILRIDDISDYFAKKRMQKYGNFKKSKLGKDGVK